jgi:lipopolysaccharide transport system permease protein
MVEFEIKAQNAFSLGGRELWQYRELFYFFTWRDIKVRYKQAVLGVLWAILQPLSMTLIFSLVFGRGLQVPSDGMPYPVFALSGLLIWNLFSNSLQNAASSMVANANIIRKIYFPRLIVPMSAVLTALFDMLFAFVVLIGVAIWFQMPFVWWKWVVLPPLSILLAVITSFGLGTFLAALNVKYRDFQFALPFFIQFLLFLNPVVYSNKILKDYPLLQTIADLNPIAGSIQLMRFLFSNIPLSSEALSDSIRLLLAQFGVAFGLLAIGIYYFRKTEAYFADLA